MNRPFQARFAESLIEISGLSTTSSNSRKCLRPSEVLKSEKMVENIVNALKTQFLNPFQEDIDKSKLFNLVSGCPVDVFNLIQQAIVDGKSSLKGRTIFFSNKRDCMMINEDQAILVPSLNCNHEEADTKLVALVFAANVRQWDSCSHGSVTIWRY
jgi:hypothetical protein